MSMNENSGARVIPWRIALWTAPAMMLSIPLIAMQFTGEVNWSPADFIIMGGILWGAVCAYEFATRLSTDAAYRGAAAIAILTTVVLTWINGAVGIIGDGPINVLYLGVVVAGFFGAILSRCEPRGLARTLFVMTAIQMTIPVIALMTDQPFSPGAPQVFALNAFFAMFFVGAGLLFRQAK
jgi:hypothetical protein